jgi:serine/threonine protein kinase
MIGRTISHYKIIEKIGEGGMGMVYKALDTRLKREVAIKFLPPAIARNTDAREQFMLEAQAAAALNHPNIATIHEIDEVDDDVFFVMEYITGRNLRERIEAGTIEQNQCLDITVQITEGLRAAHQKGIIHRDIKSANIMLTEDHRIKVMDFGLATRAGQEEFADTKSTFGTPAYMSPEQIREGAVDHRTDIWGLGVIMYEMLSDQMPFQGVYEGALLYSIMNDEPPPVSDLNSDVSEDLLKIVEKALAKNPENRFQHIDELLDDLNLLRQEGGTSPAVYARIVEIKDSLAEKESVPSTAVLPFSDISPQKDQEYFCDGITEELIDALSKVEGWRVVSRRSSFAFKGKEVDIRQIGDQLNVTHLLEGSVRKAGNRLRISAQLVSVKDGFHLWSEKYDRELEDIFEIQEEIARAIVNKLKIELGEDHKTRLVKRYTENLEAYNLYLKARFHLNKRTEEGLRKGIAYCEQAIAKDPTYAPTYSGLADGFILQGFSGAHPPREVMPKAREAAGKALPLDDSLAEAHTSLACIEAVYEWDWQNAESEFKRALTLNPNYAAAHHWYAINYLVPMERYEEALAEIQKAQEIDPMSEVITATIGLVFYFMGRYDAAVRQYKSVLEMDPGFNLGYLFLGRAYGQTGKYDEALSAFEKRHLPEIITKPWEKLLILTLSPAIKRKPWKYWTRC